MPIKWKIGDEVRFKMPKSKYHDEVGMILKLPHPNSKNDRQAIILITRDGRTLKAKFKYLHRLAQNRTDKLYGRSVQI